jgi:hypothetical protein
MIQNMYLYSVVNNLIIYEPLRNTTYAWATINIYEPIENHNTVSEGYLHRTVTSTETHKHWPKLVQ